MKFSTCIPALCIISLHASAQIKNKLSPEVPCCSIVSVGPVDGIIASNGAGPVDGIAMVRNNITGRTFFFNAARDIKNIRVGDAVATDPTIHIIRSVNGVTSHYSVFDPGGVNSNIKGVAKPFEPCCGITKLEAKTAEPCCGIITVSNHVTGQSYSFNMDESYLGETEKNRSVLHQLQTGQAVAMDASNKYVLIKTNFNGQTAYYSYPVTGAMETNSIIHAWEMETDPTLTGITGRIALQLPRELPLNSHFQVFIPGESKATASWFGNHADNILPGNYDILIDKYRLTNVPVEKGKTTRLKVGVLHFSARQSVTISDAYEQKFTMAGPFRIALPAGTYYINGRKDQPFYIKDMELTEY